MLKGFIALAEQWLTAEFSNAFPALAGIFASIVSALLGPQAAALKQAMIAFTSRLKATGDWEQAFTFGLNLLETEEFKILGDLEKSLFQAFMFKGKPS